MKYLINLLFILLYLFLSVSSAYATFKLPDPWYTSTFSIESTTLPPKTNLLRKNIYEDRNSYPYILQNDTDIPLYLIDHSDLKRPKNHEELPAGIIPLYKIVSNRAFINTYDGDTWNELTDYHKGFDGKVYIGLDIDVLAGVGVPIKNYGKGLRPLVIPSLDSQPFKINLLYGENKYDIEGKIYYEPYYPSKAPLINLFIWTTLIIFPMLILYLFIKKNQK